MEVRTSCYVTQGKDSPRIRETLEFIMSAEGLHHPIVLHACSELGILEDQILPKTIHSFEDKFSSKDSAYVRLQHYEARRRARLVIIAEFLIDNGLFTPQTQILKLNKSCSSSMPNRSNCINTLSQHSSGRRVDLFKKNLIKRLKFEENRKKIKAEEEASRKEIEKKTKAKLEKSEKKEPGKKKIHEERERRIKEILLKKYQDLDEHELKALNQPEAKKEEVRVQNFSINFQPKIIFSVFFKQDSDEEIELKLMKINAKLNCSVERAKKALVMKANSVVTGSESVQKVKKKLEDLRKEENGMRLMKIQQSLIESQKRREEMILREQRKRAESSKVLEERRIEELLKAKLEIAEKEKVFELKECQREQHRENIRKSFTKRVQSISQKNYSKKQEQEFNLEQINKHIRNYRKNQIQRYRESEILSKSRLDSDFSKIKSHLEFELRKSKQLN